MKKANSQPQVIQIDEEFVPTEEDMNKYLSELKIKTKPRIIFFGSDIFVRPVLEGMEDNFEVVSVVTSPDSAISRIYKGPIFIPEKLDEDFIKEISAFEPDLIVVASYGKIIPKAVLEIPKYGALNVHPSLLPKFRGPSPVPATILAGETETGVTIIKMDEKMDHGPIVGVVKIELMGNESFEELINKLFELGAAALVGAIPPYIEGKLEPEVQNEDEVTTCKMMKKEDGFFEIDNPPSPEILDRMIRAYTPWPGVWTKWKDKIVKFFPGNRVQMEGKRILSWDDFLNGYQDFPLKSIDS